MFNDVNINPLFLMLEGDSYKELQDKMLEINSIPIAIIKDKEVFKDMSSLVKEKTKDKKKKRKLVIASVQFKKSYEA